MKKIIALDIDQYRVGVSAPNYEAVFSSLYAEVARDNWKHYLLQQVTGEQETTEILLGGEGQLISWGTEKPLSKRAEAYQSFGDVLTNLNSSETINFVRTVISYLSKHQWKLFEIVNEQMFQCSVVIAVSSEKLSELKELEKSFVGTFRTVVNGNEVSINIKEVVFVPKTFGAMLGMANQSYFIQNNELNVLNGVNYIIDQNDNYLTMDVYDGGELIKNIRFSGGLYELASQVVEKYRNNIGKNDIKSSEITSEMVYQLIVNQQLGDDYVLFINGKQKVDLTDIIVELSEALTKKILSYLNQDSDIHLANLVLIRDLEKGLINQKIIDDYLETFEIKSTVLNNKDARGAYLFGLLFLKDEQKSDALNSEAKTEIVASSPDSAVPDIPKESVNSESDTELHDVQKIQNSDVELKDDVLTSVIVEEHLTPVLEANDDLEITNLENVTDFNEVQDFQNSDAELDVDVLTSSTADDHLTLTSEDNTDLESTDTSEVVKVSIEKSEFSDFPLFDSDLLQTAETTL